MCKPVHNQSLSLSSISIVHNGGVAVVNNLRIPIQYSSIHTQLLIQHVIQQQQQRQRQLLQQQQQQLQQQQQQLHQQHLQQQRPPMPTPTPTPTPTSTIPPAMSTAVGNGTTVQPQQQRIGTRSVRKSRRIADMTNRNNNSNDTNNNNDTNTNNNNSNNSNNNHNRSVLHHQRFFLYIKIMLRILYEHKEYNILYKSKTTIDHCIQQNKAGNDNYSFFHDSIIVRLRTFVPELYWNLARDYLGYTCD